MVTPRIVSLSEDFTLDCQFEVITDLQAPFREPVQIHRYGFSKVSQSVSLWVGFQNEAICMIQKL